MPPEPPVPPDAELVAALAGGDRSALAELYARHAPWLVIRLTRRCADRSLVDEIVERGLGPAGGVVPPT